MSGSVVHSGQSRVPRGEINGDGYSSDSRASCFSCARVNNEALPSLPLQFSSGQNVTFPPVALWVTVGLAVCLFVLLIALAAVCRRKIKESCEEARREGKTNGGDSPPFSQKEGSKFIGNGRKMDSILRVP